MFQKLFILIILFTPAFAGAHEGEHRISITADGYEPSVMTLNVGETVLFTNLDSKEHWPASNIHPTHTVYPGTSIRNCGSGKMMFDSCRGLLPNESWEFTFNYPGEWRYHDHLRANLTGSVTVIGEATTSSITKDKKPGIVERLRLVLLTNLRALYYMVRPSARTNRLETLDLYTVTKDETSLKEWLKIFGFGEIMKRLLSQAHGATTLDCHQEAHQIGRVSYELWGAQVFSEGNSDCHSGFYHGAMETLLTEEGTVGLANTIDRVCSSFSTRFTTFECLHGVGHGVMAYQDYNLPAALLECKKLSSNFAQRSCYGGVFMENIVTAQGLGAIPGHTTSWVSEDFHFPCSALPVESYDERYECYQMQTSWMLTLAGYEFQEIARECLNAPSDMVGVCFKSLGRDIAGHTLRVPEKIIELCSVVPDRDQHYTNCIIGALNVIIDFWGPKLEREAHEFCAIVPVVSAERACYGTLEARLPELAS